jgi:hypothetical protein
MRRKKGESRTCVQQPQNIDTPDHAKIHLPPPQPMAIPQILTDYQNVQHPNFVHFDNSVKKAPAFRAFRLAFWLPKAHS